MRAMRKLRRLERAPVHTVAPPTLDAEELAKDPARLARELAEAAAILRASPDPKEREKARRMQLLADAVRTKVKVAHA